MDKYADVLKINFRAQHVKVECIGACTRGMVFKMSAADKYTCVDYGFIDPPVKENIEKMLSNAWHGIDVYLPAKAFDDICHLELITR